MRSTGPVHMIHRLGFTTLCEKDSARCRWAQEWERVTCTACLKFKEEK